MLECKTERRNSQCEHDSKWSKQEAWFAHATWLSLTTPVWHLANEFDVRSKLHGQVSLAAVNQILCRSWGYERLQNSKDSLMACFENVNIKEKSPWDKSLIGKTDINHLGWGYMLCIPPYIQTILYFRIKSLVSRTWFVWFNSVCPSKHFSNYVRMRLPGLNKY